MSGRAPLLAACGVAGAIGLGLVRSLSDDEAPAVRVAHAGAAPTVRVAHTVGEPVVRLPHGGDRVGATATSPLVAPTQGPEAAAHDDTDAHGCEHGGPGGPLDEVDLAALQGAARDVVRRGPAAALEALRGADEDLLPWVAGALLDDVARLCDLDLVQGLAALASDPQASHVRRLLALELLGRSPGTDVAATGALRALTTDAALDEALRASAVGALSLLARTREDLVEVTRAALLEAAASVPSGPLRADALAGVRTVGASSGEVARLAVFLADPDADVRATAARALGGADARERAAVAAALERALAVEHDPAPAAVMLAAAVLTGRAQTDALLARLQAAPLVRADAALSRQVADYRALLAEGETDPHRVLRAREAREDARLAGLAPSG